MISDTSNIPHVRTSTLVAPAEPSWNWGQIDGIDQRYTGACSRLHVRLNSMRAPDMAGLLGSVNEIEKGRWKKFQTAASCSKNLGKGYFSPASQKNWSLVKKHIDRDIEKYLEKVGRSNEKCFDQFDPDFLCEAIKKKLDPCNSNLDEVIAPIIRKLNLKKKIDHYIDESIRQLKTSKEDEWQSWEKCLETVIHAEVRDYQHRGFLKRKSWQTLSKDFRLLNHLVERFCHGQYAKQYPGEVEKTLTEMTRFFKDRVKAKIEKVSREEIPNYSVHKEGARFKAFKKDERNKRAAFTQIKASDGKVYELLNTLDENELASLKLDEQHGISKAGKIVLGKGASSKVRLARDTESGEIVAVKKMQSRNIAEAEIAQFNRLQRRLNTNADNLLVKMHSFAHVHWPEEKSYIFMDMAGDHDGFTEITQKIKKLSGAEKEAKIKEIARSYAQCVSCLHGAGFYHGDIKPENFFHGTKGIKLGDFLGITDDNKKYPAQYTLEYISPELAKALFSNAGDNNYTGKKNDAFALGITLLALKNGTLEAIGGKHLNLLGNPVKLAFEHKQCREKGGGLVSGKVCQGIRGSRILKGNTLDEVIAKLLDADPRQRISPKEVLTLPYFS